MTRSIAEQLAELALPPIRMVDRKSAAIRLGRPRSAPHLMAALGI